jgi:beta-glucosidase
VVVLNTGAPFTLPWADQAKALLQTWLPGEAGPEALARVLFGESAPSGRLPVTFPRRMEDTPAYPYYRDDLRGDYGEGLFMGYRHYDRANIAPLFAFGHGLTYSRFSYADVSAPETASVDDAVAVTVRLVNTGSRAGAETVQLYVRPISPRLPRPVKELKAFQKVEVAAGETAMAALVLPPRAFAFYDPEKASWVTEPGAYELLIGASVDDIRLRAPITLV